MSNPKRQHYIPQCYLGPFADPNMPKGKYPFIWIFDKNGKRRRRDKIKNVLLSKDLYTLKIKGQKNYSIETTLSNLEGKYAKVFREKIQNKLPLSEEDHIILCVFVASMLQRTLRYKDNLEKSLDELIWKGEALARHHGIRSKEVEKWKNYKNDAHKMSLVRILPDLTRLILKMNVAFLCAKGNAYFVTSDDPCNLFNPDLQWQKFGSPGLGQKNVQMTLPLSPDIMLCMSWSNLRGYMAWERSRVEEANRMTVGHCYKYFVSRSRRVKRMWFRRYPMNFLFILKILRHKITMCLYRIKMWYKHRHVRRK